MSGFGETVEGADQDWMVVGESDGMHVKGCGETRCLIPAMFEEIA